MGGEAGGQQRRIISALGVNWGTTINGILLGMRHSPHGVLGTARNEVISPASFCRDCLCRFDNSLHAHRAHWLWSAKQKGLRRLSLATLPGLPSSLPPSQISTEHLPAPKGQLQRLQNTEQIGDWSPPPEFTMETYNYQGEGPTPKGAPSIHSFSYRPGGSASHLA